MPATYLDFAEERLELGHDYGVVGGPSFLTTIINNGALDEQRNAQWWRVLRRWQLGSRMLLDSDIDGRKEVDYLREFHAARFGSQQGFRFKDWTDYQVVGQLLGISDGVTTNFQLKKTYTAGIYSYQRAILKPVQGTVKLFYNDTETTDFSCDHTTGLITLNSAPTQGTVITADFEFDVPVTFERDTIDWTLEAVRANTGETLHKLGDVFVKEMRINLDLEWYNRDPIPQKISEALDLGYILDTVEQKIFSTSSTKLDSGYAHKKSDRATSKTLLKLPARIINREELDALLNYFYVAKGRLSRFNLKLNGNNYDCRFNSDALSISYEHKEGLYKVSGLAFYSNASARYQILFGSVATTFSPGDIVFIAGQVRNDDGVGVGNLDYVVDFPFGVEEFVPFTTNELGFFRIQLEAKENLEYPTTTKLLFINQGTKLSDATFDIEVASPPPYSLSVPNILYSGATAILSGVALPESVVKLSIPELGIIETVLPNIDNSWEYLLPLEYSEPSQPITISAEFRNWETSELLATITKTANISQNAFEPIVQFSSFQYN